MLASFRRSLSHLVGWLADRRIPGPLRPLVYRTYALITGADPSEAQLPLKGYTSLGAFFVRRLKPGARPLDDRTDRVLSPADGRLQALDSIHGDTLLQAKGREYSARELLAGADENGDAGADDRVDLSGASAWTIYLGPKDYHRVHTPIAGRLVDVRWVPGDRRSVAPSVLERKGRVFATNERAVLRLESAQGPYFLVMVGALNVGRIRVIGVEPGAPPVAPRTFERGDELARFEMGSTVVVVVPGGWARPLAGLAPGAPMRLGCEIGSLDAADPGSAGGRSI